MTIMSSRRALRVWAPGTLLSILLAGCTVGPDFHSPDREMPMAWATPTTAPTTQRSVATTNPVEPAEWWTTFGDPRLDSLVARAIEANLDLIEAEARAQRGVVAAGFWPTANTSGSYRRSGGGDSSGQFSGGSSSRDLYRAGLDASWELDIFGGTRRNIEAAEADIQFAVEDRRDVMVTLTSEVALNYLDLRGAQRQITIARQNLQSQQQSAELTRRLQGGGFVGGLDLANAEAQVATTQSQIPLLEASAMQSIYNLSVLLGLEPGTLVTELSDIAPIPTTPPEVPVGLPSELLRRRPDIRRAEAQLHAATARIGVATADLFPRFSLTGSLGLQGSQLKSLGNWSNRFWSIGPDVSWPIFDAGRIRANIEVQNAIEEQALVNYQRSVLVALQDVETALVSYDKEQQHRRSLVDAVAANRRAVDLATQLYRQGQTDFLNVLSAQRSLFVTEDALVQSDRTVATDLVALYKALGGGWDY